VLKLWRSLAAVWTRLNPPKKLGICSLCESLDTPADSDQCIECHAYMTSW
jgi:uncharacterized paraquat-inducible protein A